MKKQSSFALVFSLLMALGGSGAHGFTGDGVRGGLMEGGGGVKPEIALFGKGGLGNGLMGFEKGLYYGNSKSLRQGGDSGHARGGNGPGNNFAEGGTGGHAKGGNIGG